MNHDDFCHECGWWHIEMWQRAHMPVKALLCEACYPTLSNVARVLDADEVPSALEGFKVLP